MTLTVFPADPLLDLDPWVGQRQCTYRFELIDGPTGENRGMVHPIRGGVLSHDTARTIKRQLSLSFGKVDTALINAVRDRILVTMVFPGGQEYPLGRYMFSDTSRQVYTAGKLSNTVLNDEMFLVDQQITTGINANGLSVTTAVVNTVSGLPVRLDMEPSPYESVESWSLGASRGQVLESLALTGDFFSPWFNNVGELKFIRSFDPATRIPDLDWDRGRQVIRDSILESDDLLTAPNTFVVIANGSDVPSAPTYAIASVPPSAPHSEVNRGFKITQTVDIQVNNISQANAVAQNLVNRQTVYERAAINTAPDPRHDSYNVIKWRGDLWLELAWSMQLIEGGTMSHVLRKSYRA